MSGAVPAPTPEDRPDLGRWLLLAALLLLGLRALSLPLYPLIDRTEARYGLVGRTMAEQGDFLMPHLFDEPFFAKPPLSMWCQAISMRVLGTSELALRLPAWLCALAVLVLVVRTARRVGGARAGPVAGIVYLTCPLAIGMAGAVMTDPYLGLGSAMVLHGMASWLVLPDDAGGARLRAAYLWLPLGLAVGMLAKGPIVLVPLAAAAFVLLITAAGRARLRRFPFVRVLGIAALLAAPWFVLAERAHPGHAEYYFVGEHVKRFLEPDWKGDRYGGTHARPKGTIWAFLAICALPWIWAMARLALPGAAARRAASGVARPVQHALLAFAFGPLVLFTFAGSVIPSYPLPSLAPIAVVLGVGLAGPLAIERSERARRWLVIGGAGVLAALVLFVAVVPREWESRSTQRPVAEATGTKRLLFARNTRFLYSAYYYAPGRVVGAWFPEHEHWDLVRDDPAGTLVVVRAEDWKRVPKDVADRLVLAHDLGERAKVYRLAPASD